MPWIQLKLNTTGANAEDLSDALMEAGAVSITFQDTHDTPVFEPLPGETRLWGDTDVIGLFDAETDMNDVVAILENHPLLGAGFAHKIEQLEDKDWEREWMDNFHPMRFGERLWICPSRALHDTRLTRRHVMKGLLLLLGAGGGWQLWQSETGEGLRADYRTAKGTVSRQQLEDGSLLTLNTHSAADVRFDAHQRTVRLWYGEIAITTAKDALQRPFRVLTRANCLLPVALRM